MKKTTFAIGLLCASLTAWADNCDKSLSTFDEVYCTGKLYASIDDELNKNYKALRKLLTPAQKAALKQSQLAWIDARDQACVAGESVNVNCRLEFTQSRNDWLRERIRECQTIGCANSKLAQ